MSMSHIQRVRMLYKTCLKLHYGLPDEIRVLGDAYVKDEFKRHKKCSPEEAKVFMHEWASYAIVLAKQLGIKGIMKGEGSVGKPLTEHELELFREEQLSQLYELMREATKPQSETTPS